MRVAPICSFNPNKTQQKSKTPSFQADVRVDYKPLIDFPQEVADSIRPILKRAETAYEDEGSDNMLFELTPFLIGKKGFFSDSRQYGISITKSFKDIERARKELLENNDNDHPGSKYPDISKLRERDPEVMKRLKIQDEDWVLPLPKRLIPDELETKFIYSMKVKIHNLKYGVPKERQINTSNGVATGPYQGEGGGGG